MLGRVSGGGVSAPSGRVVGDRREAAMSDEPCPLPQLLDVKALRAELGVTRAAAEKLMRRLPVVQIEGLRKTYVRRGDVAAYLEARTFSNGQVPV